MIEIVSNNMMYTWFETIIKYRKYFNLGLFTLVVVLLTLKIVSIAPKQPATAEGIHCLLGLDGHPNWWAAIKIQNACLR